MTLIAAGTGLRKRAQQGFAANAKLEGQEIAAAEALETARNAQQMNTLGTGAGVGAMYGLKNLGGTTVTSAAPSMSQALGIQRTGVNAATSGLPQMSTAASAPQIGSAAQLQGTTAATADALGVSTVAPQMSNVAGVAETTAALTKAGGDVAAVTSATGAAGAGTAAAGTGAAATGAGAGAAGAGSGALAGLSAVAAPIAIGLGVAYLINKLFD